MVCPSVSLSAVNSKDPFPMYWMQLWQTKGLALHAKAVDVFVDNKEKPQMDYTSVSSFV